MRTQSRLKMSKSINPTYGSNLFIYICWITALITLINENGIYPFIALVAICFQTFTSLRSKSMIVSVFFICIIPSAIVLTIADFTNNYYLNPGRLSAPQTKEISYQVSSIILLLTSTFLIVFNIFRKKPVGNLVKKGPSPIGQNKFIIYLTALVAIFLNGIQYSDNILVSAYGSGSEREFGLSSLSPIYLSLLVILFTNLVFSKKKNGLLALVFAVLFVTANTMLSGSRVEVVGLLLALTVGCLWARKIDDWVGWVAALRYTPGILITALVAAFTVGMVRSEISVSGSNLKYFIITYRLDDLEGITRALLGTWYDATFVGQLIVYFIHSNILTFSGFQSYVDIIISVIPQAFIQRPVDRSIFLQSITATGGGVFFPFALFWAGGIWAIHIIAMAYAFLFSYVENKKSSPFFFGLGLIMITAMFRLAIYGEQPFFKLCLGYLVIYGFFAGLRILSTSNT